MKRLIATAGTLTLTLFAGTSVAQAIPALTCSATADCSDSSMACIDGMCQDKAGFCQSDDDCAGAYDHCRVVRTPTPTTPLPGADADAAPEEPVEEVWGKCEVAFDSVPVDAECQAMCELVAGCNTSSGSSGTGSASAPPNATEPDRADAAPDGGGEPQGKPQTPEDPQNEPVDVPVDQSDITQCAQVCSYSRVTETGLVELTALDSCIAAATCNSMLTDCEPAAEAWFEELEPAIGISVGSSDSGGTGNKTLGSLSAPQEPTGFEGPGGSGCASGGDGLPLGGVLMVLLAGLALALRRRLALVSQA